MSKVKIGWAEESLVPSKKVSLAGQFFERISEYVESEISVTAMAVESNGEQMILASADVVAMDDSLCVLIREKLAKLTDEIDPMKLVMAATHTHTSLNLKTSGDSFSSARNILGEFLPEDKHYKELVTADKDVLTGDEGRELVSDKVALAAYNAWKNRKEALYANEFGRVAVGMCRRAVYNDGSAQMWGDTNTANFVALEGGNDSGVELIYTFDTNKKITGVVANICCPAQILEQRSFISADFWGRAKANIRKVLGEDVFLLGLPGAGGDQCPRDLIRWIQPETPIDDPNVKRPFPIERRADPSMYDISGCNRVGKRISNEILSVLEEVTEYKSEGLLKHEVLTINAPLRKATIEEYKNSVREIEYYIEKNKDRDFNFEDIAYLHVHTGVIERYRKQQKDELVPLECHIMRFGDVAFATNQHELFLDYANVIKARSLAKQTFIIQLCCGAHGYLPTEKAEKGGHYSAYISSGNIGHEGGDLLVRESITAINKMFTE